jgi:hypothetical protein
LPAGKRLTVNITFVRGEKVKRSQMPGTTVFSGRTFIHVGWMNVVARVRCGILTEPHILKNAPNGEKHATFG